MENIEPEKLIELMDALYYQPCAHMVHFAQNDRSLCSALAEYCETNAFHYQLNTPDENFFEAAKMSLSSNACARVTKMPLSRPKFHIGGKEYDYAIVTLPIEPPQRLAFLRKVHEIMRGHAKIVLFAPHRDLVAKQQWIEDLETALFVATSTIEEMFEHHTVILSTKMHGWGESR